MKLLQLRLRGFRSYRDAVEIDFADGLNVLAGPNESGKTGILLGIQTALFMPRLASEREALRAEGEAECQVGLDYELPDGGRWRLERDVARGRGSLSQLTEAGWLQVAGSVTEIATAVRGHTGCDEQLFRATLLVRHEQIEVADSSDLTRALSDRLEVLVAGSPGGVSAARAVTRLQQAISRLTGPRAGSIALARDELDEARQRLAQATASSARISSAGPRIEELKALEAGFEAEREEKTALIERAAARRRLEGALLEARQARLAIDRALDARSALQQLETEASAARARLPAPPPAPPPVPVWAALLLGAGIAIAVIGLLGVYLRPLAGAVAVTLGIALAVAGQRARRRAPAPPPDPGRIELERAARAAERSRDEAAGMARALDSRPSEDLLAERARHGRDLQELEAALAAEAIFEVGAVELERAAASARELPLLARRAAEERIRLEVQVAGLESSMGSVAELEDQVAVREAELTRLGLRAEAMGLANSELAGAIEEIRRGVGPNIAAAASRHLQEVVPGYGVRLETGLSFRPGWADGSPFQGRQLSDGTADQFYYAVRAALAEVLLAGVNPPLLLDDPFRYCDSERRADLHRLLLSMGLKRQVLYFTIEPLSDLSVTHPLPLAAVRSR